MATLASQLEATQTIPADIAGEVYALRRWTYAILGALVAVTAGCAVGLIFVLPEGQLKPGSEQLLVVALLGGALGSSVSAIRSICDRLARGFELEDGRRLWPHHAGRGQKMSGRILPNLVARPIMGAAMGVVAYAGVAGGLLIATSTEPKTFNPEGILFFAVLAGLFAKTFLWRLDIVFKTLLGEPVDSHHDDVSRVGKDAGIAPEAPAQ